jgi:hypothetical protein
MEKTIKTASYLFGLRATIVILILINLSFLGCAKNPFLTRGSEPPLGSGGTWETPATPEMALQNLLFAYNERVISNYELCFSDSFVFSSPEDSIDAVNNGRPDLFADWDKRAEVATATNIFRTFSGSDTMSLYLTLALSPDNNDLVEDSLATLYRNYLVTIVQVHAGTPDTVVAQGLATFHLWQEGLNWWTIWWWEDLPALSGALDWGDFKAGYR